MLIVENSEFDSIYNTLPIVFVLSSLDRLELTILNGFPCLRVLGRFPTKVGCERRVGLSILSVPWEIRLGSAEGIIFCIE